MVSGANGDGGGYSLFLTRNLSWNDDICTFTNQFKDINNLLRLSFRTCDFLETIAIVQGYFPF